MSFDTAERPNQIFDDDIDLLNLIGVLWRYKFLVIGLTVLSAVAVVTFAIVSILLPPERSPSS